MAEIVKAWISNTNSNLVVTIPKSIREELKVGKGSRFIVRADKGKITYELFTIVERGDRQ